MRIKSLSITNYRSCVRTSFEPHEHLSVLIGPNGSGKTNVLSALRLLPALCFSGASRFSREEPLSSPSQLRVVYHVGEHEIIYVANVSLATSERNLDEITSATEEWWIPSTQGRKRKVSIPSAILSDFMQERHGIGTWTTRRTHLAEWLRDRKLVPDALSCMEQIVRFASGISYYSASQFTNPGSAPVSFEVESEARRRVGISLSGHKRLLFDVYQAHRAKSDTYTEFISLVGPEGIGLIDSLDFEEIKTSSSSYSVMTGGKVVKREKTNLLVVPRVKIGRNTLSPSQLSEGTFKTLALVFSLVTDKSSLLMIEEPEVCVHYGLLSSIVELIKQYAKQKQIIVSTHSDSVLDKVLFENVFGVTREGDKGTQVKSIRSRMSGPEVSALRHYLENEGSLGEFWKHGDLEEEPHH
jgi:ABC-type lipoprotein export system ATPase subunit